MTRPVLFTSLLPDNSSEAILAMAKIEDGMARASKNSLFFQDELFSSTCELNETTLRITSVGAQSMLMGVLAGRTVGAQTTYPVIQAFTQPALPAAAFSSETLHVLATLQQELFVDAKHLATSNNNTRVYLLLNEAYSTQYDIDVMKIVESSLETFRRALDGMYTFNSNLATFGGARIRPKQRKA